MSFLFIFDYVKSTRNKKMNFEKQPSEKELSTILLLKAQTEYTKGIIFQSPMTLSTFKSNGNFEACIVDKSIVMQPCGTRVYKYPNGWGKIINP